MISRALIRLAGGAIRPAEEPHFTHAAIAALPCSYVSKRVCKERISLFLI